MNRTIAPGYSQAEKIKLILPESIELHNGVQLYWMKDVKDESVKLDIEWTAGSKYQEKKLVAGFTNRLLLSGNDKKSAKEIAEQIDYYGGYTQLYADKDHAGITIYGLVENIQHIFSIFTAAFDSIDFPLTEFEKERTIALSNFKIDSEKVKNLCSREFTENLFGKNSAYGQTALEEDFSKLERDDLITYYNDYYKEVKPVIFLCGNVPLGFIEMIKEWSLRFTSDFSTTASQKYVQHHGRVDVPKKDAIQSAIKIGCLMFDKKHEDYYHFQLLNTILGGYFGSRLMANIREDKGYTYGVGSAMAVLEDAGYFFITTEVATDVKDATITEIYYELDKLKNSLVSEDELTKVKNYMLGEFLRHADGPIAMMEMFKNIYFNNLSIEYYSDFINAIHDVSAEDLNQLANKYFVKENMLEVVVG